MGCQKRAWIPLLLTSAMLAACATNPVSGRSEVALMSKADEVKIGQQMHVQILQQISKPFLNWAGKAERHQIQVPTAPLLLVQTAEGRVASGIGVVEKYATPSGVKQSCT